MTLGMAGVVTGAIIVINHGNVSGKVAPIMTRIIARPISADIPIPGSYGDLADIRAFYVAAAGTYSLREKSFCHRSQPGYSPSLRV